MEEKISFLNDKGHDLIGVINRPAGKGPFPAVIDCHGFTGSKDEIFHPRLAESMTGKGYVVLRFDFTGNGESGGKISEGHLLQEVEDVKAAIGFLSGKDYVDKDKIGLCGHSMGGIVAILASAQDSRIKAVAPISPGILYEEFMRFAFGDDVGDLDRKGYIMYNKIHEDGVVRVHKLTKEFFDIRRKSDVFETIKDVRQPVLMIFGTNDGPSSSPEAIQKLFENAKDPKYIEIIEGADHRYTDKEHEMKMIEDLLEFFGRYLK